MAKNSQITDFFGRRVGTPAAVPGSPQASRPSNSPASDASLGPSRKKSTSVPGLTRLTSSVISSPPSSTLRDGASEQSTLRPPAKDADIKMAGADARLPAQEVPAAVEPDSLSSSPSPQPAFSNSPKPPPKAPVRSWQDEIKASDDEDSDDSDDFPDILAPIVPKDVPVLSARDAKPWETPRAKRRVITSLVSPHMPRDRKLAMDKLVAQAKQYEKHDAILAGIQKLDPDVDQEAEDDVLALDRSGNEMDDMLLQQDDSGRLLQAVKRTGAAARKEWNFFVPHHVNRSDSRKPFPRSAATGNWKFLQKDDTRSDFFVSGIVYAKQCRHRDIPHEIMLWVLNEITWETSGALRGQYHELAKICEPRQIREVVTDTVISQLFRNLGGQEEAVDPSLSLTIRAGPTRNSNRGTDKDWSNLVALLDLLTAISDNFSDKARMCAVQVLLRLGIDSVVWDVEVGTAFREAIHWVIQGVPEQDWDEFCATVALSLYVKVEDATLRWETISACLDASNDRLRHFTRILALASSGAPDLDNICLDMADILDRLDDAEFTIQADTDYYNLAALVSTLSLALADGNMPAGVAGKPSAVPHDDHVDAIALKLRAIESKIHFSSMNNTVSRMAAKSQLGNLQTVLLRITRSREPPELGIMNSPSAARHRDIPRQQKFMSKFLTKAR